MTRTDEARRKIDASPVRVFAALTTPESLERWLAPDGMTARVERFDARAGGETRMVLTYDDARDAPGKSDAAHDVVETTIVEFEPGVRIVQAITFETDDDAFAGVMRMTWEVLADGAHSQVLFRAEDVPSGISAEDHVEGLTASLRNLAALVER
ncbi:SRPBCC domain-containing protein [Microbacterium keratanolyticum]